MNPLEIEKQIDETILFLKAKGFFRCANYVFKKKKPCLFSGAFVNLLMYRNWKGIRTHLIDNFSIYLVEDLLNHPAIKDLLAEKKNNFHVIAECMMKMVHDHAIAVLSKGKDGLYLFDEENIINDSFLGLDMEENELKENICLLSGLLSLYLRGCSLSFYSD